MRVCVCARVSTHTRPCGRAGGPRRVKRARRPFPLWLVACKAMQSNAIGGPGRAPGGVALPAPAASAPVCGRHTAWPVCKVCSPSPPQKKLVQPFFLWALWQPAGGLWRTSIHLLLVIMEWGNFMRQFLCM